MLALRLFAFGWLLGFSSGNAAGQGPLASPAAIQARLDTIVPRLGNAFIRQPARVGVSVGIVEHGRVYCYNFGSVEKGTRQLPTPQTVYEIGSISKTFAGLLLAHAVLEKRVRLDDDIRKYLPGPYSNLAYHNQPIRLVHLVNTTSRLPDNLPESLAHRPADADSAVAQIVQTLRTYTKADFYADLHHARLDTVPGLLPGHSNVAAQLLVYILEGVYRASYAQLVARYIDQPLHLAGAGPPAVGYNEKGHPMPFLDQATATASALRYGAADMAKYLQYQLAEQDPAVALTHRPAWGSPDVEAIGFNWNLEKTVDGQRLLRQSGGTFGHASYCELRPGQQFGVVLLANESDPGTQGSLQAMAEQLVAALYGVPPALQALQTALTASGYQNASVVLGAVKTQHPELHLTEEYVNAWAYRVLRQGQLQQALALFKLNVGLFPGGWNTYDSLAEAYESLGAQQLAVENYRRSLALNPKNDNATQHLQKLGAPH